MMLWLVLVVTILGCDARLRVDPLVETKLGLIRGLRSDDGYSMFLGVPYARVNESNVFGPSIPITNYERTFEAFDDSVICPQVDFFSNVITGGLDCLTLNIFVPSAASKANLMPVMVWIHGGAFEGGSSISSYNGANYLVKHNVVLVTVQYRLGPYGFMCLDTPEVSGNQGLKDQVTAFRWIKENINAFGGNPNSITLFGTSAGSMSIDLHLQSDQEPLFHKAIMQSGAAVTPRVTKESDASVPLQISAQLGFVTDDLDQALAFLAKTDVHLVIAASKALSLQWRTCPEKDFDGVEKFINDFPINTQVPKAKSVAILAGYNSHEFGLFDVGFPYYMGSDVFAQNLDLIFDFGGEFLDMEKVVRHFYIGDEVVSDNVTVNVNEFLSDFTYNYPVQWTIEKFLRNGAKGVYHYVFSYPGLRSGARHGDEQRYLLATGEELSEEEQVIRDRMTTMWTNFAKYGDPTPATSDLLPVKWTPATEGSLYYLDIGERLYLSTRPYHTRLTFWDLYFKTNWEKLRVMSKFAVRVDAAVSALGGGAGGALDENDFIDASRLVYDAVREIRRAVLMNRTSDDLDTDTEFEPVEDMTMETRSRSSAHTGEHGVDEYPDISGITNAREAMRKMTEEDKRKILQQVELFRREKMTFDNEVAKWDDAGNDIIMLAKHMCMIMLDMTDFTRGRGPLKTTMDVINAAKKISEAGTKLDKLTREIAEQCPESSTKQDLLAYLQRIALYCHQIQITSKVKADVQNISGELIVSGLDSATSLIQAAKNLMNAVVLTVKASYVASTKYTRQGTIASPIVVWRMKAPEKKPLIRPEKPEEVRAKVRRGSQKKQPSPVHALAEFQSPADSV